MWQMKYYKAAYRSTPNTVVTSADVGALFGTSGFIKFTAHANDKSFFGGIELLRDADRLEEHIGRFATGGRYSLLALTDFYLIDFRRINKTSKEKIATDMDIYEKLFVVTFDATLENVIVVNSKMEGIFKMESPRQL
uniref:Uncharacterized protein n=1 Tax=Globisporangium ultimum (strain ATCC 200006 / CBS 805.95 / DAOM BR144) TaxID=431595 RepID=K3X2C9_GLOUD